MAANVLGLFFLVLWTSGIVDSIYVGNGWDGRTVHPWNAPLSLRWKHMKYSGIVSHDFDDIINHFSDLKPKIPRQQFYQPDIKFDKDIFQKYRVFIPNVAGLNSDSNSILNRLSRTDPRESTPEQNTEASDVSSESSSFSQPSTTYDARSASIPEENTATPDVSSDSNIISQASTTYDETTASTPEDNTEATEVNSDSNIISQASTTFDETSASTPEDNTEAIDASSESNVISQASTTSDVTQKSTSELKSSTSYSTDADQMQSTNQETTVSDVDSRVSSSPVLSTDKKTEVTPTTSGFTESKLTSLNKEVTEIIPQDHVIKIQSIRTARVIVSVVFIVISLVAVVVLAIYMFRAKRRAAQYDQLMLLP